VKAVGAGYIILLGLRAIRDRRALSKALDAAVVPRSDRRIFLEGFIVGAVFVLIALVCDSAWVFVAGTTGTGWLTRRDGSSWWEVPGD
jgi:threonine/homoserine/homoserine lactone efflux protein